MQGGWGTLACSALELPLFYTLHLCSTCIIRAFVTRRLLNTKAKVSILEIFARSYLTHVEIEYNLKVLFKKGTSAALKVLAVSSRFVFFSLTDK